MSEKKPIAKDYELATIGMVVERDGDIMIASNAHKLVEKNEIP